MVHGNYYGLQYEIYLNKELDLFNDILPICIHVRKMISLEKVDKNSEQYKLVIISHKELDKRFYQKQNSLKYAENNDLISHNHNITRKSYPEEFKYYDVKNYKSLIKHNKCPQPFTQEELKKCEKRFEEITDIYNDQDFWSKSPEEIKGLDIEQYELIKILNIQRIISNPSYFEEIKEIERELTDIELTDGEKELIDKVLTHPNLEGYISSHGINLINIFY